MKRSCILSLFALAVFLICASRVSAQTPASLPTARNSQNENTPNEQSEAHEVTPHAILSAGASTPQPSPPPNCSPPAGNAQSWNDWLWQNLSSLLLVLVAVGTGYIAVNTLRQISCQTVAATTAASAAKKSADTAEKSLTHLERPWIFIDILRFEGFRLGVPSSEFQLKGLLTGAVRWSFRNYGRSPAFILDGAIRIRTLDKPFREPPDYGVQPPVVPVPISPNKSVRQQTAWGMDEDDYRKVIRGESSFAFYGYLRYRDTFQDGVIHTTRWCAVLTIPALRLTGQPEWYWGFEGPPSYIEYT
jgi:hypothetical protein